MSSQYHAYYAYCGDIERDAKNIFLRFYFEFITIHTTQSISIKNWIWLYLCVVCTQFFQFFWVVKLLFFAVSK